MSYTQSVDSMFIQDGVVKRVVVLCTLTDGERSASVKKDIPLFAPDPETFVAYENLTEEQVLAWCPIDEGTEEALQRQLDRVSHIKIIDNFPWQQ